MISSHILKVLICCQGYEVRRYQPAKWVSTTYTARTAEEADQAGTDAFYRLFDYIDGSNERGGISC